MGRIHVFCGRKGRRINLGFKLAIFLRSVDLGLNFPVCHRNVLDGEDCRIGLKLVIFLSSIALSFRLWMGRGDVLCGRQGCGTKLGFDLAIFLVKLGLRVCSLVCHGSPRYPGWS